MLPRKPIETPRTPWRAPVTVVAILGALAVWRTFSSPDPIALPPAPPPVRSADAPPAASIAPRCEEISAAPFIIGEPPPPKPTPAADPSARFPGDPPDEIEEPPAPFAVEVGRGAAFAGGFAVGARRESGGKEGTTGMIAIVGPDGANGKLVRLGRLRGDLDPPAVAGAGDALIAVMVEPNAGDPAKGGGRSLRVAKVKGGEVTWGPELPGDHDDSPAIDVAATADRAFIVWDDIVGTDKHGAIMLASVDVPAMRPALGARAITASGTDAERPRLVARPGGYWLAYIARGAEKPSKKADKKKRGDTDDDRELGEIVTTSWIEVMPLDESGAPVSAGRAVSAKGGHVLSFDLDLGDDGGALLAWRDDDTPTGSSGGRLMATLATLGGAPSPRVLSEETSAAGVPDLLAGWLALAGVNGATRIAAISPKGELLDDPAAEKALGGGIPVAASAGGILWARPLGQAMRLSVVRCKQRPPEPDAGVNDAGR